MTPDELAEAIADAFAKTRSQLEFGDCSWEAALLAVEERIREIFAASGVAMRGSD
jgi:hypothetical protein